MFLFVKMPSNTGTGSIYSAFEDRWFVSSVLHQWARTSTTVRRHSRYRATIRMADDLGIRQTSVEHAKFSEKP